MTAKARYPSGGKKLSLAAEPEISDGRQEFQATGKFLKDGSGRFWLEIGSEKPMIIFSWAVVINEKSGQGNVGILIFDQLQ